MTSRMNMATNANERKAIRAKPTVRRNAIRSIGESKMAGTPPMMAKTIKPRIPVKATPARTITISTIATMIAMMLPTTKIPLPPTPKIIMNKKSAMPPTKKPRTVKAESQKLKKATLGSSTTPSIMMKRPPTTKKLQKPAGLSGKAADMEARMIPGPMKSKPINVESRPNVRAEMVVPTVAQTIFSICSNWPLSTVAMS